MINAIYTSPMGNNTSVVYVNSSSNSSPSDQPLDLTCKGKTQNQQVSEPVSSSRENDHFGDLQHVGNTHIIAAQSRSNEDTIAKNPILRELLNRPPALLYRIQPQYTVNTISYGNNVVTESGRFTLKP